LVTVVTIEDVARFALALPDVTEGERHGARTWFVGGKGFVWERRFSKADIRRFGDAVPPAGPILAVAVADLHEKEAALAAHPRSFFTIAHFDGYAAVLIQMKKATKKQLEDAVLDAWLAKAPPRLTQAYLQRR
jgi:hypothetical protein